MFSKTRLLYGSTYRFTMFLISALIEQSRTLEMVTTSRLPLAATGADDNDN